MTPERRTRALVALAVVLSVSFALLAHAAVLRDVPSALGVVLSVVPLVLLLAFAARRGRRLLAAAATLAGAGVALWLGWDELERHFTDLFFLEHAGLNVALAAIFGRTLRSGEEPLVTRFARIVHGELPPGVASYTRGVTIAWTLFFVAMVAASCALYFAGLHAAWSFLASILNPVLVAAMFVVEYALRHRMLPHLEPVGILGGVRAFMRHFQGAPAPR